MPRRLTTGTDDESQMDDIAPRKGAKPGPKLTQSQTLTLLDLIATYWEVSTVEAVLRIEHPDFPEIGPTVIRYHRRNGGDRLSEAMETSRNQVLHTGLALKDVRIAHYTFPYQTLGRDLEKTVLPDQRLAIIGAMSGLIDKIGDAVEPKKGAVAERVGDMTNNVLVVSPDAAEQARQIVDQMMLLAEEQRATELAKTGMPAIIDQ